MCDTACVGVNVNVGVGVGVGAHTCVRTLAECAPDLRSKSLTSRERLSELAPLSLQSS